LPLTYKIQTKINSP